MDSHTFPSVLREDAFAFNARQDAFASEGGGAESRLPDSENNRYYSKVVGKNNFCGES